LAAPAPAAALASAGFSLAPSPAAFPSPPVVAATLLAGLGVGASEATAAGSRVASITVTTMAWRVTAASPIQPGLTLDTLRSVARARAVHRCEKRRLTRA